VYPERVDNGPLETSDLHGVAAAPSNARAASNCSASSEEELKLTIVEGWALSATDSGSAMLITDDGSGLRISSAAADAPLAKIATARVRDPGAQDNAGIVDRYWLVATPMEGRKEGR
jgi:hypothetical protein